MNTPQSPARNMVFHAPYPLNRQAGSASGIRPVRMRDAFEALGYTVHEVTGHSTERRAAMKRVRAAMRDGVRFDFCYSESSTMPTPMTDPHHLPLHPLMDHAFLAGLRRHGVKVGLFYRDIYWRFGEYGTGLHPAQRQAALAMYRFDLLAYRGATDIVYLPSAQMAPYLRANRLTTKALPPGHADAVVTEGPAEGVHLFYVGGLGTHYRLHRLAEAVQQVAAEGHDVTLTLCMPAEQWQAERPEYQHLVHDAVRVVHASGSELQEHYDQANMAALFNQPNEYWTFAMPVKMFEYIGQGKPIVSSEGTLSGQFVAENDLGWTVPYTAEDAAVLLRHLAEHPDEIRAHHQQVLNHRDEHSWLGRARTVATDLSSAPLPA